MGRKLYVGNLEFGVTDDDLQEAFAAFGSVTYCRVITDRETGRSRGFGFVEMSSDEEAQKAMESLDNQDLNGRPLRVNEARQQEDRGGRPRY